ncbi:MAG TPA: ATP-binding cassette domain-containing protein [Candidatus Binatia bacterium]|nr:ATP-binding cassette domain-containing protein [Candidatus Binatia bacterium]
MTEVLRAERVSKTWHPGTPGAVRAVRDASLAVAPGETVVVTGPSGSGKTTLLAMLGSLLAPDRGRVLFEGRDLAALADAERRRVRLVRIGFVFQRALLVPQLTARQNVALVPRVAGVPRARAFARADALLERLGMAARAAARPRALSPGEQQRVAVARALAAGPGLVLADEPTAHLDADTGTRVVDALRSLAAAERAGLVVVTHDARLAALGDRVLRLDDGVLSPVRP